MINKVEAINISIKYILVIGDINIFMKLSIVPHY